MKRGTPIWITGVGAVTPLGHSYEVVAEHLLEGRSGIQTVSGFDVSQHPSQIAAQVERVPCPPGWNEQEFYACPKLEQMVLWGSIAALKDSGWWDKRTDARIGIVLGLGAEWLAIWDEDTARGGSRIHSHEQNTNPVVRAACQKLALTGPALSIAAACASGNYAIAQARRWLQLGWVDVCLAGGCDASVRPLGLAGFGNLRALSRRNHEPQAASRPFDRGRDGFVMAEGGAIFTLESAESARRRSAPVYGEVAGFGASSDAHHMVIPSPDPVPAVAAMRQALADACVEPEDIDYVNAHATSTPVGDVAEARVLELVFEDHLMSVSVSSTKGMTGHCLTGAAAIEVLACLVALDRHAIPPTINLDDPDPQCNLCHVANQAQPRHVHLAASNSFGFGGSNTCLVLKSA